MKQLAHAQQLARMTTYRRAQTPPLLRQAEVQALVAPPSLSLRGSPRWYLNSVLILQAPVCPYLPLALALALVLILSGKTAVQPSWPSFSPSSFGWLLPFSFSPFHQPPKAALPAGHPVPSCTARSASHGRSPLPYPIPSSTLHPVFRRGPVATCRNWRSTEQRHIPSDPRSRHSGKPSDQSYSILRS